MKRSSTLIGMGLVAVLSLALAVNEAWTQRSSRGRVAPGGFTNSEILGIPQGMQMPDEISIRIAFIGRADRIGLADASGLAESLQADRPGVIIGMWSEEIVAENGTLAEVRSTLETADGAIFWEGTVLQLDTPDGGELVSSAGPMGEPGVATITGGTGEYEGILGTAELHGRTSLCTPGVTRFCATLDGDDGTTGFGVRVDWVWILDGTLPRSGNGSGDDDDDDDDDDDGMGCGSNSGNGNDCPILDSVARDTPPVSTVLDPTTGVCTFTVEDWTLILTNTSTELTGDLIVQQLRLDYDWSDPMLTTPSRMLPVGAVVVPAGGMSQVVFPPIQLGDLSLAYTGQSAEITIEILAQTVAGDPQTDVVQGTLHVEACE